MERRHAPVKAPARGLVRARERRADHHRVGAERDRLRHVAAVAHPAVGDHLAVLARLQHVRRARVRDVRDRRRLRHADPEHAARRAGRARPDADEHAGGAGAHQVQSRVVGGAAADDDRHLERRDELLQVQRLGDGRDVLPGDDRPLDHEHVEPGLERELVVLRDPLRRQRRRDDDFLLLDLPDPLGDQLRLHGLRVDLLHLARGLLLRQLGDPLELLLGVLVAREDALEVQHRQPAEVADDPGRARRDDAVHRRGHQRQLELVGAELPGEVDVVGVARAPRGDDRDVVESVCLARLLAASDLYLHRHPRIAADSSRGGPMGPASARAVEPSDSSIATWRSPGLEPTRPVRDALGYARLRCPSFPQSYDPQAIEARRQAAWRAREAFRTPSVLDGGTAAQVHQALRPLHLGQHPHRPRPLLLDRRRLRALRSRARRRGAVRLRLRRLRPARRARRDRRRRAAERVGRALRRAHDRTARATRLLVRLAAHVHELRRDHVPLVAVAVPDAARGGARLSRDRQRRLVRHLPDDARDDPGRGRPLLALPQPGPADRASDLVPARERLHGRRTTAGSTSCRPAANGTRSRSPASASCSAASTVSRSSCPRPPTARA